MLPPCASLAIYDGNPMVNGWRIHMAIFCWHEFGLYIYMYVYHKLPQCKMIHICSNMNLGTWRIFFFGTAVVGSLWQCCRSSPGVMLVTVVDIICKDLIVVNQWDWFFLARRHYPKWSTRSHTTWQSNQPTLSMVYRVIFHIHLNCF